MARKPRMGRNLNALLSSAVRERREQSDERPDESGTDERDGAPANEAGRPADVATLVRARRPAGLPGAGERDAGEATVPPGERSDAPGHPAGTGRTVVQVPSFDGSGDDAREDEGASAVPEGETSGASARMPGAREEAGAAPSPDAGRALRASGDAPVPEEPARAASERVEPAEGELPHAPGDPPRPGDRLRMIGVERIRRGVFQPRRFFDQEALQELADSIAAQGMIQPVIVRPFGGAFELIAGERRWRAAQIAGLAEIPAIVREMEDRTVAAVSLIENIQREDLNPLEEAQALTRLCDEFGMTHASVAESIGRSRASVSNLMRLLDLHDEVKVLVDKGELDMGHARALLRVPKVDQPALALRVAQQGLTVRAVEKLIRTGADKGAAEPAAAKAPDPDIERLEERLSSLLGAPVSIRHKAGGAGRLEIRYTSLDELDGILTHIR